MMKKFIGDIIYYIIVALYIIVFVIIETFTILYNFFYNMFRFKKYKKQEYDN